MKNPAGYLIFSLATAVSAAAFAAKPEPKPVASAGVVLVMHGGAGTLRPQDMKPELEKQYVAKLEEALRTGHALLAKGAPGLDAIEAAIKILEDSPLYNAGKGAVFTHEGTNELDAAIMDGATKKAGAVAGVKIIKNPISAARAVMANSPFVMLAGRGAELFATAQGLEVVDPSYFWTEKRWQQLQKALQQEEQKDGGKKSDARPAGEYKFGTVGAVALDAQGHLAAGTSTGGMTNKRYGRIGDSPVIGAGTYADDASCAVSATGHGEFFIRYTVAREIAALVQYKGLSVDKAANEVVNVELKKAGGDGGVIALDARGNFAMPFNTEGMYRGYIKADGVPHVQIYK